MDERATLKDPALQRYYDEMFAMFASPGWAYLMEDLKQIIRVRENIRIVPTDKVDFVKGELVQADWLAGLEQRMHGTYDLLLDHEQLGDDFT